MAVCPGNTVEPLPCTSENIQNKEVCSLWVFSFEDLIDKPLINSAKNCRTLPGIISYSLGPQGIYSLNTRNIHEK